MLKVNGVTYHSSAEDAWFGAYKDEVWTWTNNPNTGSPWTVSDVNGVGSNPLQTFGYECLTIQSLRCTQIYIEVLFSPDPVISIMRKPLMRDSVTGDLMRDDGSGKLMRAVEAYNCACFDSGKTPLNYTLTFAGVLLCATRSWPGGVDLNQKWLLEQYDPVTLPCY